MRYEEFRATWDRALDESRMRVVGWPSERIDPSQMERNYKVGVEPFGGQDAEPFFVTALLSWRWGALHAARSCTTEEDFLTEIHGREQAEDLDTEPPWLRVDVELRASLPWGNPVPMPAQADLSRWIREVTGRLEHVEPLLPEETVREVDGGLVEVLAWKGTPRLTSSCEDEGELVLHDVTLAAWHALTLPRCWDDPEKVDPYPDEQIANLFAHVRTGLLGWMDCLDHLGSSTTRCS